VSHAQDEESVGCSPHSSSVHLVQSESERVREGDSERVRGWERERERASGAVRVRPPCSWGGEGVGLRAWGFGFGDKFAHQNPFS